MDNTSRMIVAIWAGNALHRRCATEACQRAGVESTTFEPTDKIEQDMARLLDAKIAMMIIGWHVDPGSYTHALLVNAAQRGIEIIVLSHRDITLQPQLFNSHVRPGDQAIQEIALLISDGTQMRGIDPDINFQLRAEIDERKAELAAAERALRAYQCAAATVLGRREQLGLPGVECPV